MNNNLPLSRRLWSPIAAVGSALLLLYLSAAPAEAASVAPYDGTRIFWDMASESTVFGNGGYARAIELQDGRIMATCEWGGINVAYSSNGGVNWTAREQIAGNPQGISNAVPDLIQLSDGTIIVGYNPRPHTPYSEDRHFGMRCKRSTDNGASWGEEIIIYDGFHDGGIGCWEPSFLELPSGEVQCYFADESPFDRTNEQQISVCRSFDKGLTWSAPERVSFRPNNRDGMPVPILLKDPDEIVVIVEDNGWYRDMGTFTPTTVRCPLETNWHDFWVAGPEDRNRDCCVARLNCYMGAPYLRQLADGSTIISTRSQYQRATDCYDMMVYCGNDRARGFKALSAPFGNTNTKGGVWPSLCVVDNGTNILAVTDMKGTVKCMKGYPMRRAQIAYSDKITLDGKINSGERYTSSKRNLLPMGTVIGNRANIDLAYDENFIYFTARVLDNEIINTGYTDNDYISLMFDPANLSTDRLEAGLHRFELDTTGELRYRNVSGTRWALVKDYDKGDYKCTVASKYFVMEAAIPWDALGLDRAPEAGSVMRLAIEIRDRDSDRTLVEKIPDADSSKSSTWFEIEFLENPNSAVETIAADAVTPSINIDGNGVVSIADGSEIAVYDVVGRRAAIGSGSVTLPARGLWIISAAGRSYKVNY